MNKITVAVFSLFLVCSACCYAQSDTNMRSMAIDQLYEYGEAIYARGDYSQAAMVFSRILAMDPTNEGALGYANNLKKKGEMVTIPAAPIQVAQVPAVKETEMIHETSTVTTQRQVLVMPVSAKVDNYTFSGSNQDLQRDIQEADDTIEKMKSEISNLHEQVAKGQQDVDLAKNTTYTK